MKPGDIYRVNFDPSAGHEITKRRPALVISDEKYNLKTKMPVVLPITSKGGFSQQTGLVVDLGGFGLTTYGAVLCCRPMSLDFEARGAEYVEDIPKKLLDNILLKTVTVLFPSLLS
jgi:mRNA-degrading endonuclease toxin of MazEF toxin-antitoxin module